MRVLQQIACPTSVHMLLNFYFAMHHLLADQKRQEDNDGRTPKSDFQTITFNKRPGYYSRNAEPNCADQANASVQVPFDPQA